MGETPNARVIRLEKATAELAESQVRMQKAQAQMQKYQAQMQKAQAEMKKSQAEMKKSQVQMQKAQVRMDNALAFLAEVRAQDQTEAREREKRIDGRIEKLVIAIGELIQHMPRDGRSGA